MVKEIISSDLVTIVIDDLELGLKTKIEDVAKRRGIGTELAAQQLLAAGMMVKSGNLEGFNVSGRLPDGTVRLVSKAEKD